MACYLLKLSRGYLLLARSSRRAIVTHGPSQQCNSTDNYNVKPVVVETVTCDQKATKLISKLITKVKAVTGRKIKISDNTSYERLILHLVTSEHRSVDFDNLIKEEVTSNIDSFRPSVLPKILSTLLKHSCINRPLLRASSEKVHELIERNLDSLPDNFNFGQIFWVLGKTLHYNESLCDSLLPLIARRKDTLSPWMMGNIAWYCARIQYYDRSLLEQINNYTLQNLDEFPRLQMSNVVYALGQLNHDNAELMAAVGERLERESMPSSKQVPSEGVQVPSSEGVQVPSEGVQLPSEVVQLPSKGMQLPSSEGVQVPSSEGMQLPSKGVQVPSSEGVQVPSEGAQVYWVYVWTSMVLGRIRPGIAARLLDNQFIEGSKGSGFHLSILLQLSIAVNYEHKELGLSGTKSIPSKWGESFDSIQNVDVKHIQKASLDRLDRYKTGGSASMFSENVKRALTQVVGEDFYNSEAISLSGYIMDFELLLDSNNRPVRIPRRWKRQWKESVVNSIHSNRVRVKKRESGVSSLIEKLESAETSTEFEATKEAVLDSKFDLRMRINLASDWGSKFEAIPRRVTRRIAIEVDGLVHFAANCDHVMGRTIIKHKQLQALGWELLQIPYQEWELLQDGDAHVDYLAERIFAVGRL